MSSYFVGVKKGFHFSRHVTLLCCPAPGLFVNHPLCLLTHHATTSCVLRAESFPARSFWVDFSRGEWYRDASSVCRGTSHIHQALESDALFPAFLFGHFSPGQLLYGGIKAPCTATPHPDPGTSALPWRGQPGPARFFFSVPAMLIRPWSAWCAVLSWP